VNALINLGLTEHLTDNNDSAMKHWLQAKAYLPQSPHFPRLGDYFYNKGMNEGLKNVRQAIDYFKMATQLDETKSKPWSNMGGAYFTLQKYDSALYCWQTAIKIDPRDMEAQKGYQALTQKPAPPPAK
jgi:tetratricopeptide (TPR) repeat protein